MKKTLIGIIVGTVLIFLFGMAMGHLIFPLIVTRQGERTIIYTDNEQKRCKDLGGMVLFHERIHVFAELTEKYTAINPEVTSFECITPSKTLFKIDPTDEIHP